MDVEDSTKNKLNLITRNVNSLISNYKKLQLNEILEKKNLDVMLINETKLNDRHIIYFKKLPVYKK